jgi:hypothetical protein
MDIKIELNTSEHKDLISYCKLNKFDQNDIVKKSYLEGFRIEKYGLLHGSQNTVEKIVEKEVIKYVEVPKEIEKEVIRIEYIEVEKPVEKIIEVVKEIPVDRIVEVIKEIPVEKVVIKEVVKEIPVDKVVEKVIHVSDDKQINELLSKIEELENRPPEIKEVIVDRVVEVEKIVEVVKEVIIEKEGDKGLQSKLDAIQQTLMKLRTETLEKDRLISEYEKTIEEIQKFQENKKAVFLRGSNLDDKLYK